MGANNSIIRAWPTGGARLIQSGIESVTVSSNYSFKLTYKYPDEITPNNTFTFSTTKTYLYERQNIESRTYVYLQSCCECPTYFVDPYLSISRVKSTVPIYPQDPYPEPNPNDSVLILFETIPTETLQLSEGWDTVTLSAKKYELITVYGATWFPSNIAGPFSTAINTNPPPARPIRNVPWTSKQIIAQGVSILQKETVDVPVRKWVPNNTDPNTGLVGNFREDFGVFAAFPADKSSGSGCLSPTTLSAICSFDGNDGDLDNLATLSGTFSCSVIFNYPS